MRTCCTRDRRVPLLAPRTTCPPPGDRRMIQLGGAGRFWQQPHPQHTLPTLAWRLASSPTRLHHRSRAAASAAWGQVRSAPVGHLVRSCRLWLPQHRPQSETPHCLAARLQLLLPRQCHHLHPRSARHREQRLHRRPHVHWLHTHWRLALPRSRGEPHPTPAALPWRRTAPTTNCWHRRRTPEACPWAAASASGSRPGGPPHPRMERRQQFGKKLGTPSPQYLRSRLWRLPPMHLRCPRGSS